MRHAPISVPCSPERCSGLQEVLLHQRVFVSPLPPPPHLQLDHLSSLLAARCPIFCSFMYFPKSVHSSPCSCSVHITAFYDYLYFDSLCILGTYYVLPFSDTKCTVWPVTQMGISLISKLPKDTKTDPPTGDSNLQVMSPCVNNYATYRHHTQYQGTLVFCCAEYI